MRIHALSLVFLLGKTAYAQKQVPVITPEHRKGVVITPEITAKYSYVKSWMQTQKVIDYVIIYNAILIKDTNDIKCVIDELDFTDVEIEKVYNKQESFKIFRIDKPVWYIRTKKNKITNAQPIIECLCR